MIRIVIKEDHPTIFLQLPEHYVGKKVEVTVFSLEEAMEPPFNSEQVIAYFASEETLAKDWLSKEENKAWHD